MGQIRHGIGAVLVAGFRDAGHAVAGVDRAAM